jgi:hypothetical protein
MTTMSKYAEEIRNKALTVLNDANDKLKYIEEAASGLERRVSSLQDYIGKQIYTLESMPTKASQDCFILDDLAWGNEEKRARIEKMLDEIDAEFDGEKQ